jgi:alkanesulfonate monooxygenase SsuD/methylene tetrahydromethanopterin reductase-like flavin-dependent oxidoreductase (luciferase family)
MQHLSGGGLDLMLRRGNTPEVYSWFGRSADQDGPLAVENYALLRRLWREDVVH